MSTHFSQLPSGKRADLNFKNFSKSPFCKSSIYFQDHPCKPPGATLPTAVALAQMGPPRDKSRFNEHLAEDDAYRSGMQSPPPPIPETSSVTPSPLKRAGAIRRPSAPKPVASDLRRPPMTFEELDMVAFSGADLTSNENNIGRSKSTDKDKPNPEGNVHGKGTNSNDSSSPLSSSQISLSNQDWLDDSDEVCTVKRSGGVRNRLDSLITRLEKLWINADKSKSLENPRPDQASSSTEVDNECDEEPYKVNEWKEYLVWNLESIRELMKLLKIWTLSGVPASDMGCFLECVLYQRDEHMGETVTRMIDANKPYADIAQFVMQHYQIRDDDYNPLWTNLDLEQSTLRPNDRTREFNEWRNRRELLRRQPPPLLVAQEQKTAPDTSIAEKDGPWFHVPAPTPVRPISWPFLIGDLDHGTVDGDEERDEEVSICRSFGEDCIVLGNVGNKFVVESAGHLPRSMTAEITDGEQTISDPFEISRKTDTSKPLPPLPDDGQTNSRPQHSTSRNAEAVAPGPPDATRMRRTAVVPNGTTTLSCNVETDTCQTNHSQRCVSPSDQHLRAGNPAAEAGSPQSQYRPSRARRLRGPIPASVLLEHIMNATHKELGITLL